MDKTPPTNHLPEDRKQLIQDASIEARRRFRAEFQRIHSLLQSSEPRGYHALTPPALTPDDAYTATLKGLADLYSAELSSRLPKRILIALVECAMFENAQLSAERARLKDWIAGRGSHDVGEPNG